MSGGTVRMQKNKRSIFLILFLLLGLFSLGGMYLFLPKLPQPQSYHRFAGSPIDTIWSSLVFIPLGIWGMAAARSLDRNAGRFLWMIFFQSVIFIGLGSAYYHADPTDFRLMVDRLPIAVALMTLICILFGEEAGAILASRLFFLLAGLGVFSVVGWMVGEARGEGDLRLYVWVHLFALLTLVLFIFRPMALRRRFFLTAAGLLFAGSKLLEFYDHQIFSQLYVSGHVLKHLADAVAVYCLILYCRETASALRNA